MSDKTTRLHERVLTVTDDIMSADNPFEKAYDMGISIQRSMEPGRSVKGDVLESVANHYSRDSYEYEVLRAIDGQTFFVVTGLK